jgi:hypothetical protein
MRRGAVYFVLVFAAGFVLGAIRVPLIVPRLGERAAELLEAPVMLGVIWLTARAVVRRLPADRPASLLGSGALALALLVAVELTVVLRLRGLTIAEYVSGRDPVAGGVYAAMLVVFAFMPWWVDRASRLD